MSLQTDKNSGEACLRGCIADMHTHSEHSHDSQCKMEDMYKAQMAKGTALFAVTDHFDAGSYPVEKLLADIKASYDEACRLNEKHGDERILKGIEISEAIWHSEDYKKAMELLPYDVVIGSVHLVSYKDITDAYSREDLSRLSAEELSGFMHKYFADMQEMVRTLDFDILAHLTCPIRYIEGKYKIKLDLAAYDDEINAILEGIIKRGIALEVNTSSLNVINEFFPPKHIIKRYRDMGGYLVTLGSDAHVAQNASAGLDAAVSTLKEAGFDSIYCYRKRKPCRIEL